MTSLFQNAVTLRGFLGRDAEVPASDGIKNDAYAVLTLCIESGTWKKTANEWIPWTAGTGSSAPARSSVALPEG